MAVGDLVGTLTGNGGSVLNPSVASGSVSVAIGDLVFGVMGQQTNLTVTAVTDNLGNTYVATNAGTDPGTPTGRAFWSIATVAGTLTAVNFAATASANNYAVAAAVITGPFMLNASQPGPNPANGSDAASPFLCPATGALPQPNCVVMSWLSNSFSGTAITATSPTLLALSANNTSVQVSIGYQKTSDGATVAPAFTAGSNPTTQITGTTAFRLAFQQQASMFDVF